MGLGKFGVFRVWLKGMPLGKFRMRLGLAGSSYVSLAAQAWDTTENGLRVLEYRVGGLVFEGGGGSEV